MFYCVIQLFVEDCFIYVVHSDVWAHPCIILRFRGLVLMKIITVLLVFLLRIMATPFLFLDHLFPEYKQKCSLIVHFSVPDDLILLHSSMSILSRFIPLITIVTGTYSWHSMLRFLVIVYRSYFPCFNQYLPHRRSDWRNYSRLCFNIGRSNNVHYTRYDLVTVYYSGFHWAIARFFRSRGRFPNTKTKKYSVQQQIIVWFAYFDSHLVSRLFKCHYISLFKNTSDFHLIKSLTVALLTLSATLKN